MSSILILTEHDDCTALARLALNEYAAVILAFWASPEFAAQVQHAGARVCWRLNDLVGDYAALVQRAYRLAHDFIGRVPSHRNVNPLLGSENTIANALLTPLIAADVVRALHERVPNVDTLTFLSPNDMQRAFDRMKPTRVLSKIEMTKRRAAGGRLGAWLTLVREAQRDHDWAKVIWTPIEVLDRRYAARQRLWQRAKVARGGILCYSSYINYSRTLAKHAHHFTAPPRWVINNHSAQIGLPAKVHAQWLWQFDGLITPPSQWMNEIPLPADSNDLPLRAIVQSNQEIREVFERTLPLALAEVDLMEAMLDTLQPDAVWVANQWGSEAALIQLARAQRIPVIQVQHGVLEQYYACAPIYSDRFLVWGEFWKRAVNPREQAKVAVNNPGFEIGKTTYSTSNDTKPRVTFFTAPTNIALFWNPSVALWETMTLLTDLHTRGHSITVRVHPADRIEVYRRVLPTDVSFSKGGALEAVLNQTDVALMAFSTVFLNCLASGIPVIGTGWYPFIWQMPLNAGGYMRFADSLAQAHAFLASPPSIPALNDLLAQT